MLLLLLLLSCPTPAVAQAAVTGVVVNKGSKQLLTHCGRFLRWTPQCVGAGVLVVVRSPRLWGSVGRPLRSLRRAAAAAVVAAGVVPCRLLLFWRCCCLLSVSAAGRCCCCCCCWLLRLRLVVAVCCRSGCRRVSGVSYYCGAGVPLAAAGDIEFVAGSSSAESSCSSIGFAAQGS